jgi:hypothetical protein
MTDAIPADTGSADPGAELRLAANTVRERYRQGSAAYGFWRVIAGIWERWADRLELGVELSPVAHAEFQAALFSARKYLDLRHGGWEAVTTVGAPTCTRCGHVFASGTEPVLAATELAARLLGHVCAEDPPAVQPRASP